MLIPIPEFGIGVGVDTKLCKSPFCIGISTEFGIAERAGASGEVVCGTSIEGDGGGWVVGGGDGG